ncbi:hypothetical protein EYZ11_011937 [Aspergillus tanneri]|uniref:protein-tyrosine-phosphatase n=1 Tax=Aspergillus tanneri TaxID=1220188 RepID=A0A4S3J1K6_9EURO|nr:hypothetical protein EYZ11_011937 [Aspergillus tanneri]
MPVQTSPPSPPDSFPTFMSVFGERSPSFSNNEQSTAHRESISSMTSGSTDSSPTTTISTFDSLSAPDTSPSSSPESPLSMPLPFPKFMAPMHNVESQMLSLPQNSLPKISPESTNPIRLERPDSPGRRARNLKNLSLRMPPPSQSSRPPIATASFVETTSQRHLSAPPSPVHIPPKSTRRRPANLTIRTPGFDKSFSSNITEMVPPTPHALRHTESSPSLTSIFSPSFGPKGGMQLPRPMTHHGTRRPSATSEDNRSPLQPVPDEDSLSGGVLHELEEEDDQLDSRESTRRNERGYPNGPVRIYDSGLYLYLEPTAQEASQFDVVVNVAKEVANPFTNTSAQNGTVVSTLRNASISSKRLSTLSIGEPRTAVSEASFKSAFEYPPSESESPATPRNETSGPEYVHVDWDHNSEILDDLLPLCEFIDSRISEGKKVLVHCQLGASRSASLVIAYGLYKNRHLDFNSMYEIVKERSQWVGPNMSLIYQLTDFRSRLLRGSPSKPAREEWFVRGSRRSSEPQPPRSEKLDHSEIFIPGSCSGDSDAGQTSSNGMSQASMSSLSVPSTNKTTPTSTESPRLSNSLSHKRSLSPRPLPLRQTTFHTFDSSFRSVRPTFGTNPWRSEGSPYSLAKTDIFAHNASEEPLALFSPRTTGFLAGPHSVSDVLEDDGPNSLRFGARIADPRSPAPGTERLIMRNIDEFL